MNGYKLSTKQGNSESTGCWIVMQIVCFFGLLFLLSLLGMHLYFIITNWTTWEYLKRWKIWYLKAHKGERSPFDLGVIRNITEVFCHKNYPMDWVIIGLNTQPNTQTISDELSMCL